MNAPWKLDEAHLFGLVSHWETAELIKKILVGIELHNKQEVWLFLLAEFSYCMK